MKSVWVLSGASRAVGCEQRQAASETTLWRSSYVLDRLQWQAIAETKSSMQVIFCHLFIYLFIFGHQLRSGRYPAERIRENTLPYWHLEVEAEWKPLEYCNLEGIDTFLRRQNEQSAAIARNFSARQTKTKKKKAMEAAVVFGSRWRRKKKWPWYCTFKTVMLKEQYDTD